MHTDKGERSMMTYHIEQYTIMDWDLRKSTYEDFESTFREALRKTNEERMTRVTLPDGTQYTLLKVAR